MRWEERLLRELDDLELQAEGLALAERDAVVAELGASQYAEIAMADRVHASLGAQVRVGLRSGARADGRLTRAGRGWLAVAGPRGEALVNAQLVTSVSGLSTRAVTEGARPVTTRLPLASVLRRLAASGKPVTVTLADGTSRSARVGRVGLDFVELAPEDVSRGGELVPLHALELVRRGL